MSRAGHLQPGSLLCHGPQDSANGQGLSSCLTGDLCKVCSASQVARRSLCWDWLREPTATRGSPRWLSPSPTTRLPMPLLTLKGRSRLEATQVFLPLPACPSPSPWQRVPTHGHCQGLGAAPVRPSHAAQGHRVVPARDQPLEEVLDLSSAQGVPPGQRAVPGVPQPQLAVVLLSRDTAPRDQHCVVPFSHRREILGN